MANDTGYDNIFLNQLKIHFKKNDKILIFLPQEIQKISLMQQSG